MLQWRDLSRAQEAAVAAIFFGYLALFVLLRLDDAMEIVGTALAFLLPVTVTWLARSLATIEAARIARHGEPLPAAHDTLALGAPPPRRFAGPRRITTLTAVFMVSTSSLMMNSFPEPGPAPVLFALWTWAVAGYIFFAVPRQGTRAPG